MSLLAILLAGADGRRLRGGEGGDIGEPAEEAIPPAVGSEGVNLADLDTLVEVGRIEAASVAQADHRPVVFDDEHSVRGVDSVLVLLVRGDGLLVADLHDLLLSAVARQVGEHRTDAEHHSDELGQGNHGDDQVAEQVATV